MMTSAGPTFSGREVVLLEAAMNTYIQVLRCSQKHEATVIEELTDLKARLEGMAVREDALA